MVYVGKVWDCITNENWKWPQCCHMFADSEDELVMFAEIIGLNKRWLQKQPGKLIHFDLTVGKRIEAIKKGAMPVDAKTEVKYIRKARINHK